MLKERIGKPPDFKHYLRKGFALIMTRELQLQCSYTGRGGPPLNILNCFILLQASCKTIYKMPTEIIKKYFGEYFSNIKAFEQKKSKKIKRSHEFLQGAQTIKEEIMDFGPFCD